MELSEMLAACDGAIACTKWWQWRRPALELTVPEVLGVRGHFIPAPTRPGEEHRPAWGYSRRQCKEIQYEIYAAARSDSDFS